MAEPVRLGVWGAGGMGERVVRAASALPGVEVTTVLDRDPARADAVARTVGAAASATLADAARAGLDALYIGLPNAAHRDACLEAAALGLHVLVDKPLTTDIEDADAVLRAAGETSAFWMMGFSTRFRGEWRRARELVFSGAIGDPYLVTDTVIEAYRSTPGWYWDRAAGGGTLQLQSHHVFDRWEWLLGVDVAELSARVTGPAGLEGDTEVSVALQARIGAGVLGMSAMSFGRGYDAAPHLSLVVQGTRGMIEVDTMARHLRVSTAQGVVEESFVDDDWLARELEHFVAGIRGEMLDQPTLAVGHRAVVLADAAERSAATGRWVETGRTPRT